MTVAELRLAMESHVGQYLGNYSNGDKAITTGEPQPSLNATGVECIVEGLPDYDVKRTFGRDAHFNRNRSVRFLAHDSAGLERMENIAEDLLALYPNATIVRIGYQPSSQFAPQFVITFEQQTRRF